MKIKGRTQSIDEEVILDFVNISREDRIQRGEIFFFECIQEVHLLTLQAYITKSLQNVMGTRPVLRKWKESVVTTHRSAASSRRPFSFVYAVNRS